MNIIDALRKATDGYCAAQLEDIESGRCRGLFQRDGKIYAVRYETAEGRHLHPTEARLSGISREMLFAEDWVIMRDPELRDLAANMSGKNVSICETVVAQLITEAEAQFCNAAKAAGFKTESFTCYADCLPFSVEIRART